MTHILLLQLPIPQLNFGRRTGNIPLAAACLKQAIHGCKDVTADILPESTTSYLGDSALIQLLLKKKPDMVCFSLFNWNIERSIHLAQKLKAAYGLKIIFGGPEVTPDNPLQGLEVADFLVYGEGEAIFRHLLQDDTLWKQKKGTEISEDFFRSAVSPYVAGLLEPEINRMMYLETQRGCPYRCGFCYYNKAIQQRTCVQEDVVIEAVRWGINRKIDELCFLDPSLNSRPDLSSILKKISQVNPNREICISGETRAEQIDKTMADLFDQAGFSMFEIGLQSTNPTALKRMNRRTDLSKFLHGTALLKERDIIPRIDLIVGLPGDTLDTFKQSADFVAEHDLYDDIMVFPLSVLPGTDFRKNSTSLQLTFEDTPPYSILHTPAFSQEEMLSAFDYAEEIFDVSLFPDPHMDVSFRSVSIESANETNDHWISTNGREYISKLILSPERTLTEIQALSSRLTHPYQVFVPQAVSDQSYTKRILEILSGENPHTPFEVIYLEPSSLPNPEELLSVIQLKRPHYLDNDLRFLYGTSGNRAVLFTMVSESVNLSFYGEMKRQVFWWKYPTLPEMKDLHSLSDFSGLLIDTRHTDDQITAWQDRFSQYAPDILFVNFADVRLQKRWISLTGMDDYYPDIL